MELQKTKHQIKLEYWRRLVHECRNSGMTVRAWCSRHQISVQTYYRWQKQVWEVGTQGAELTPVSSNAITFAEYSFMSDRPAAPALVLHLTWGSLEIQNDAEQAVIENTLQALKKLC